MKSRVDRQSAIRDIIRNEHVRTQGELVKALQKRGFDCTQATVSRDINEMNLKKLSGGTYILPEEHRLQRMVSDFVSEATAAENLCVIKTSAGAAQNIAAVLDTAHLPSVVGTLAGDDTILVVAQSSESAYQFAELISSYRV